MSDTLKVSDIYVTMKNKQDTFNSAADDGHHQGGRHTKPASGARIRQVFILIHRYVGLAVAVFLIVAGLTGSFIAFYHDLDAAINPSLLKVEPPENGAKLMDPFQLMEEVIRQLPGAVISSISLDQKPDEAAVFYVSWENESMEKRDDTWFVNPYTAEILGSRTYGDITQGIKNLMPFIYRLHYSLALGEVGSLLFGIIALLWTIDCFVGAYITFPPPSQRKRTPKEWLKRWKPSWLVRANKLFSFVFTFHRASGLWVWAILFVFAWSSVGLNLKEVYNPVMKAAFGMEKPVYQRLGELKEPLNNPKLSWQEAYSRAKELMEEQAKQKGFELQGERDLRYYAARGYYQYNVRSSLDISERYPNTAVYLDANTGDLLAFHAPTGQHTGTTVTSWLYHLHWADIKWLGLPYRIFITVMGVVVAVLSITGVWIWLKKRRKKSNGSQKNKNDYKTKEKALRNFADRKTSKKMNKKSGELKNSVQ